MRVLSVLLVFILFWKIMNRNYDQSYSVFVVISLKHCILKQLLDFGCCGMRNNLKRAYLINI